MPATDKDEAEVARRAVRRLPRVSRSGEHMENHCRSYVCRQRCFGGWVASNTACPVIGRPWVVIPAIDKLQKQIEQAKLFRVATTASAKKVNILNDTLIYGHPCMAGRVVGKDGLKLAGFNGIDDIYVSVHYHVWLSPYGEVFGQSIQRSEANETSLLGLKPELM